jgi:hypothetical protein
MHMVLYPYSPTQDKLMNNSQTPILNSKFLNRWGLFALIVIPMSIAAAIGMTRVDLASPLGVSAMIQFSVRLAVPWLFIAFAAHRSLFRRWNGVAVIVHCLDGDWILGLLHSRSLQLL